MNRLSWLGLLVSISLSACTTPSVNESRYRLLPPAATAGTLRPALPALTVQMDQAAWLNGSAMHYQLSSSAPALLRYRDSLWADRPAALLHTQLRQRLADISLRPGSAWTLRLTLEQFEQQFAADLSSQGVVRWYAELRDEHGQLRARRGLSASAPAASANAEGGVRALSQASAQLIDDTLAWVALAVR